MNWIWNNWLRSVKKDLMKGKRVQIPGGFPHPSWIGFKETSLAEDVGQVANWSLSVNDGSRLHIHEFEYGSMILHRDKLNPEKSPLHAVGHWLFETDLGKVAAVFGGICLTGFVLSKN